MRETMKVIARAFQGFWAYITITSERRQAALGPECGLDGPSSSFIAGGLTFNGVTT